MNSLDDTNKKFNLDLTQTKLNIKREKLFDEDTIDIGNLSLINKQTNLNVKELQEVFWSRLLYFQ
jgi:hypothetical protein